MHSLKTVARHGRMVYTLFKNELFRRVKMTQPNDVMRVPDEEWEQFKKNVSKETLYYSGQGDLLDTADGRKNFCRLNESGLFRKDDPNYPGYKIWVFNNQGEGMVIKKRSRADPSLMENTEYNADGMEISKSFEPA